MAYHPPYHERGFFEEPDFLDQLARIQPDPVKADFVLDVAKDYLHRFAEYGKLITNDGPLYAMKIHRTPYSPPLAVYYEYDDVNVILVFLRVLRHEGDW